MQTSAADISCIRWLTGVVRGADDVRVGDIILVETLSDTPVVACVTEMLEVVSSTMLGGVRTYASHIRLWCSDAHAIERDAEHMLRRGACVKGGSMLVRFELAQVTVVTVHTSSDGLVITYQ